MSLPFQVTMAERIETIVNCYLRNGSSGGTFGCLVEWSPGKYRVETEGRTFLVEKNAHGWSVRFKGFEGLDRSLLEAAHMVWTEARDSKVNVSRNFRLELVQ